MASFVTYSQLREFGTKLIEKRGSQTFASNENELPYKNLFLSHSSKDDEVLPGVIQILESHGGRVYVDKKDPELPKNDFKGVAEKLRKAVKACPRFVLFITENSKESRWIPWELGLGDGAHKPYNVALFPASDYWWNQTWAEQEYLGLYRRIVYGKMQGENDPVWMVLDHTENTATKLDFWIKGY